MTAKAQTAADRLRASVARDKAMSKAATPGPWNRCAANDGNCECGVIWEGQGMFAIAIGNSWEKEPYHEGPSREQMNANMDLCAASRTSVPRLAAQVEVLLDALEHISEFRDWREYAEAAIEAALALEES